MLKAMLDFSQPLIWTMPDVLSADECTTLIARIEASAPEVATINAPGGHVLNPSIRNNTRVIFDDARFAQELFRRVRDHVPETLLEMRPTGCNERFRCYKYEPGQRFALHMDGSFVRNENERSLLTFMIYLNEGFEGGETAFPEAPETVMSGAKNQKPACPTGDSCPLGAPRRLASQDSSASLLGAPRGLGTRQTVVPRAGQALFFQHPIPHEGCEVTRGIKYAVRSDIMYRSE